MHDMNLNELEARAKVATPGPWHVDREKPHTEPYVCSKTWNISSDPMDDGDAAYIAAANPETILALIAMVREMGEALGQEVCGKPNTANALKVLAKYNELLYAVGNKYPNETRHETALRYIRKAEEPVTNAKKEMTLVEELRTLNPQFYSEWKDLAARAANRIHVLEEMMEHPVESVSTDELLDELRRRVDG
jgi:hypothetical protein